jgi:hypothetical protein
MTMQSGALRTVVDTYTQTQKLRIEIGNRLAAVTREVDSGPPPSGLSALHDRLLEAEEALVADMGETLEHHKAMPWLSQVRGVGPTLAGKMLGLIGEIGSFDTVSKLWRFAGFAVIDGLRERPVKGEKLHYSIRLKTTLYLVGGSFLKSDSPYREVYDRARAHYDTTRPDWTKAHRHLAAMRKMEKLFLSHLWQTWREAEGLPVRSLYVMEYLGHTTLEDPWAYLGKRKKDAA